MRYILPIVVMAGLTAATVSIPQTYVLIKEGTTTAYRFHVVTDSDDGMTVYGMQTQSIDRGQPFGTTVGLSLLTSNHSLSSYTTGTVEKFMSAIYKVVVDQDGTKATVSKTVNHEVISGISQHEDTQLSLLPGTTDFIVWDPLLMPEMLLAGAPAHKTCINGLKAFALVEQPLSDHPPGVPGLAQGIHVACGRAAAEIWYDPRSHTALWVRSIDEGYTWKIEP